jgi:hypothetical protein
MPWPHSAVHPHHAHHPVMTAHTRLAVSGSGTHHSHPVRPRTALLGAGTAFSFFLKLFLIISGTPFTWLYRTDAFGGRREKVPRLFHRSIKPRVTGSENGFKVGSKDERRTESAANRLVKKIRNNSDKIDGNNYIWDIIGSRRVR